MAEKSGKGLGASKSVGKMSNKNLLLADIKTPDSKSGSALPVITKGSDELGKK